MSRWKPDARGRLEHAAYELFRDRGYEQITVADIAERAGLTERTFFRHFADKREALFSGAELLQAEMLSALESTAHEQAPLQAVRAAVEAGAELLRGRRELARERSRIIAAHTDLQERELIKRAVLSAALAHGLRRRGVAEPTASLAAEMGITVFYVGFVQWLDDPGGREFADVVREGFDRLRLLSTAT